MDIIEDRDPFEVIGDLCSTEASTLHDMFDDIFEDVFAEYYDGQRLDDLERQVKCDYLEIIKDCVERRDRALTAKEAEKLGVDLDECRTANIRCVEERDEDGDIVVPVYESERQGKLFPEMEQGLPPMRIGSRKVVEK